MLPAKAKKMDLSSLDDQEQRFLRLYGKLPDKRDIMSQKLADRKYFDSGDYALCKAGQGTSVGVEHPSPANIPHSNPSNVSLRRESSLTHDTTETVGR